MEYDLAIKMNEILPSAITYIYLEGIILSEKVRQRKKRCHAFFTYMS